MSNYEMNDLLDLMVEQGASDLHLQVGTPPTIRLSGSMTFQPSAMSWS